MMAASKGYASIVTTLLESGAAADIENNKGDTALTIAVKRGHKDIASLLNQNQKIQRGKQSYKVM